FPNDYIVGSTESDSQSTSRIQILEEIPRGGGKPPSQLCPNDKFFLWNRFQKHKILGNTYGSRLKTPKDTQRCIGSNLHGIFRFSDVESLMFVAKEEGQRVEQELTFTKRFWRMRWGGGETCNSVHRVSESKRTI
ncbi:hypothetical protein SK128_023604, partial [Halocaridina rubra]